MTIVNLYLGPKVPGSSIRARIERCSVPEPNTGCWLWIGAIGRGGYGYMNISRRTRSAHRVSYEEFVGPIANGLELDHKCRVRCCVNPDHLEAVTHSTNVIRGNAPAVASMLRTNVSGVCKNGHAYADGVRVYGRNKSCAACNHLAVKRYRARRKAAITMTVDKLEEDNGEG